MHRYTHTVTKEHTRIVDLDPAKAYYTFSVSDRVKLLMLDFILLNLRPESINKQLILFNPSERATLILLKVTKS